MFEFFMHDEISSTNTTQPVLCTHAMTDKITMPYFLSFSSKSRNGHPFYSSSFHLGSGAGGIGITDGTWQHRFNMQTRKKSIFQSPCWIAIASDMLAWNTRARGRLEDLYYQSQKICPKTSINMPHLSKIRHWVTTVVTRIFLLAWLRVTPFSGISMMMEW